MGLIEDGVIVHRPQNLVEPDTPEDPAWKPRQHGLEGPGHPQHGRQVFTELRHGNHTHGKGNLRLIFLNLKHLASKVIIQPDGGFQIAGLDEDLGIVNTCRNPGNSNVDTMYAGSCAGQGAKSVSIR
ncbi:hypothetical protein ACN38_g7981 [Penicillium nordicum]|uniref:Uncharacterized protein n=1 Tax=Penicillium nordicum TaxID=229535 RepID=A0A0M8P629_9EURO|nr:hypothetical protein ACN38_g7981 [Penicillium nordicum]